jgi:heterodisulfide reductase subunit C
LIHFILQIVFILVFIATAFILFKRIRMIRAAIRLGRPAELNDHPRERWKRVILLAFGQKKMFRRIVPAFFHLILYLGFIIINIEVLEFIIDGITGNHRSFAQALNPGEGYSVTYSLIMNIFEWLALGVIIACVIFLIRRNWLKIDRFKGIEMRSWPVLDANLILIFEIVLMVAILTMNAADQLLQMRGVENYPETGDLFLSRLLILPLLEGLNAKNLIILERSAWWFHILGILGFAVYVTYSKHLHIILSFPNTYYASLKSPAQIPNMEVVTQEVKSMLGLQTGQPEEDFSGEPVTHFGAGDVTDLTWKNIMDAFTCTECGRCTAVCPANITGKKLSPRKIMMDVRDRAEELTQNRHNDVSDKNNSLFDLISREEIFACTACSACIEACPVSIDPLSIIIQMRRFTAMEESTAPAAWNMMFSNIENNFAPWKFPSADRFKWAEEIRK